MSKIPSDQSMSPEIRSRSSSLGKRVSSERGAEEDIIDTTKKKNKNNEVEAQEKTASSQELSHKNRARFNEQYILILLKLSQFLNNEDTLNAFEAFKFCNVDNVKEFYYSVQKNKIGSFANVFFRFNCTDEASYINLRKSKTSNPRKKTDLSRDKLKELGAVAMYSLNAPPHLRDKDNKVNTKLMKKFRGTTGQSLLYSDAIDGNHNVTLNNTLYQRSSNENYGLSLSKKRFEQALNSKNEKNKDFKGFVGIKPETDFFYETKEKKKTSKKKETPIAKILPCSLKITQFFNELFNSIKLYNPAGQSGHVSSTGWKINAITYFLLACKLERVPGNSGQNGSTDKSAVNLPWYEETVKFERINTSKKHYLQENLQHHRNIKENLKGEELCIDTQKDSKKRFFDYPVIVLGPDQLKNVSGAAASLSGEEFEKLVKIHEKYPIMIRQSFGYMYPGINEINNKIIRIWTGLFPAGIMLKHLVTTLKGNDTKVDNDIRLKLNKNTLELQVSILNRLDIYLTNLIGYLSKVKISKGEFNKLETVFDYYKEKLEYNKYKAELLLKYKKNTNPDDLFFIKMFYETTQIIENYIEYGLQISLAFDKLNTLEEDDIKIFKDDYIEAIADRIGVNKTCMSKAYLTHNGMQARTFCMNELAKTLEVKNLSLSKQNSSPKPLYFECYIITSPTGEVKVVDVNLALNLLTDEPIDTIPESLKTSEYVILDITNMSPSNIRDTIDYIESGDDDKVKKIFMYDSLSKHALYGTDRSTLGQVIVYDPKGPKPGKCAVPNPAHIPVSLYMWYTAILKSQMKGTHGKNNSSVDMMGD